MTAARLAARCVQLLGAVGGPVAVVAPPAVRAAFAARVPVAGDAGAAHAGACVLMAEPTERRAACLEGLAARLATGAPLVVVDYNQPRAWGRRLAGAAALLLRGHAPARAREPVARDVQAHGFTVERLRLADGERLQFVLARRR